MNTINLLYFIAGVFTGVIGLVVIAIRDLNEEKRKKAASKDKDKMPWSSIKSVKWDCNLSFVSNKTFDTLDLMAALTESMVNSALDDKTTFQPGNYTARVGISAHFTKRD